MMFVDLVMLRLNLLLDWFMCDCGFSLVVVVCLDG